MRIAIIGGGICGYSCATQILEYFKEKYINNTNNNNNNNNDEESFDVTVISEIFTPGTTGDGSAGLWSPYLLGKTPAARVDKWSKGTHDFLQKLWLSEDGGEAGVCLIPAIRLTTDENAAATADVFWKNTVYGCKPVTQQQLDEFNVGREKKFTSGLYFVTYTSEPFKLLPYLMKRYAANGGKSIQQKIENIDEFIKNSPYDVIINCTGLGAKELFNDKEMYPVRGQVARVRANWLYCVVLVDGEESNYVIPNTESVILGGTHQERDYNTNVSKKDKQFIVNGCKKIVPGVEHAQYLFDWVGLRPGRTQLRLEVQHDVDKILIHNYGHGGSGVTLSWGCGSNVLELLVHELEKRKSNKSKL